jgi:hypothetical protein
LRSASDLRYKSGVLPRRRAVWLSAAAAAVAGAVTAAALLGGGGSARESQRDQRWRYDIAYLARTLPKVHVDGVTGVSSRAWFAAANRLEAQVPRLSNGQLVLGIMRLVALLRDDETQVNLPTSSVYPLDLEWVGRHLYLVAVPRPDRHLLGAELEAVDGHPLGQVLNLLRPEIDYQDPGLLAHAEARGLINPVLLAWLGVSPAPLEAEFTARTTGGQTVTARLTAAAAGSLPWVRALIRADQAAANSHLQVTYDPMERLELTADGSANLVLPPLSLYEQNLMQPYWMRVLTAQHAVYLKYNGCVDTNGFQHLAAMALAVLRRDPAYRLIVDLRNNPGGDSQPFQALVNGINTDPAINTRGRIFGLINDLTDSSATLDAGSLSQATHAIMIGQTVEDPIDEYGDNGYQLKLPYSGIQVQYTTAVVNASKTGFGIPDIYVAPTIRQILAGQDPALEAALNYGRHQ